jgi:hypothetical protein
MKNQHQRPAPWEWSLVPGHAIKLASRTRPRWLRVTQGRAWFTQSGSGPQGEDVWLSAGERQLLPAGSEWVAEGWPDARLELLEAPDAVAQRNGFFFFARGFLLARAAVAACRARRAQDCIRAGDSIASAGAVQ